MDHKRFLDVSRMESCLDGGDVVLKVMWLSFLGRTATAEVLPWFTVIFSTGNEKQILQLGYHLRLSEFLRIHCISCSSSWKRFNINGSSDVITEALCCRTLQRRVENPSHDLLVL